MERVYTEKARVVASGFLLGRVPLWSVAGNNCFWNRTVYIIAYLKMLPLMGCGQERRRNYVAPVSLMPVFLVSFGKTK